ncbi:MAG: hypothetical protein K2O03_01155 [Lachnospiraceae bacterium]|nr:hypothetical protein [Lachnospiraceae bacterium]
MTNEQEIFWKEMRSIQDEITGNYSMKTQKYDSAESMEQLLDNVIYETIYCVMEFLDGFRSKNFRGDIIYLPSGESINTIHDPLHDDCQDHLNHWGLYENLNNNNTIKKRECMTKEKEIFWKTMIYIQDEITSIYSMRIQKYDNKEELLSDVIYEAIYSMMELFDGLRNKNFRGDIIYLPSGESINTIHDTLHDDCPDHLKYWNVI